MTSDRELDLVLFGATGFVGRLTADHLAQHAPAGTRIALAGRSRDRLEDLRASLGEGAATWPLIVADSGDEDAMAAMAARTKVVATTVGPFAKYGLPLALACAAAGTHYADLTGEVLFVRRVIDEAHELATASGARIVTACGFDSIPSDLGVWLTARQAAADGEGELTETTLYVRSAKGGPSGGTIDSMRHQVAEAMADPAVRTLLSDAYALSPDRAQEPPSRNRPPAPTGPLAPVQKLAGRLPIGRDARTGRWTGPFVMAQFNTRIVRRSNALLGWEYGRGFRYREVSDFGSKVTSPLAAAGMAAGLGGVAAGFAFGPTRAVLDRVLPAPGEGPDAEAMAAGRFRFVIETATTTGARYRTVVAAEKDPGYSGTAVMFGQAALALALDGARLPDRSGVLTPATGIGEVLVDRLRACGFTLTTERVTGSAPGSH